MSNAKHETIADIVAWLRRPREGENAYLTLWRDEIADRIEAAWKREREAGADAAQICGKIGELSRDNESQQGHDSRRCRARQGGGRK